MNTLSRAITARFFPYPHDYEALKARWKALHKSEQRHELSAAHHLLYLALRGKDWRKAFTPITNTRKLENGAFGNWALFGALWALHSLQPQEALLAPFEGLVTPAILQLVREVIPVRNLYSYRPQDFTVGTFPFEAYQLEAATEVQSEKDKVNA